jgi:hypothetical protein
MLSKRSCLLWGILIALSIGLYLYGNNQKSPDCSSYPYYECPDRCMVCPSCESCSSVRCQSEESCELIGYNRTWYDGIKERLKE